MAVIVHHFTEQRLCSINRRLCFQPNLMETQKVQERNVPTDTGCKIRHYRDFCANFHQLTSVKASSGDGFRAYPLAGSKHLVSFFLWGTGLVCFTIQAFESTHFFPKPQTATQTPHSLLIQWKEQTFITYGFQSLDKLRGSRSTWEKAHVLQPVLL